MRVRTVDNNTLGMRPQAQVNEQFMSNNRLSVSPLRGFFLLSSSPERQNLGVLMHFLNKKIHYKMKITHSSSFFLFFSLSPRDKFLLLRRDTSQLFPFGCFRWNNSDAFSQLTAVGTSYRIKRSVMLFSCKSKT